MALKTLIFGTDDLYPILKPYYEQEVRRGNLEIVAFAVIENKSITLVDAAGNPIKIDDSTQFQLAIISSRNDFYNRMKFLEAQGCPRNRIIDGRVFQIPNLDFPRLLNEGVAYGTFGKNFFGELSYSVYPKVCTNGGTYFLLGTKSYIASAVLDGNGIISVDNFSSLAWSITFELGLNADHNKKNVGQYGWTHFDWTVSSNFFSPQGVCRINIGSDVWIGRGCILKSTNPNKPLVIGDGAIIASDSVVVKNVPPYAIVGGNPAKIIKFRFSEDVIESLLRIKWWDWSLDKIHDNFKYFNDIEKFISLHDK